jgi:hypothetical protein
MITKFYVMSLTYILLSQDRLKKYYIFTYRSYDREDIQ